MNSSKFAVVIKNIKISFFFLPLFLIAAFGHAQETLISGQTMGTTYHIKVVTGHLQKISGLKEKIDKRLEEINKSMSTYRKDSEISRFNVLKIEGQRFKVSPDFIQVIMESKRLYRLTGGAWDGSIYPLVNLWGFGKPERKNRFPAKEKIASLLMDVGFHNIDLFEGRYLLKKKASISIDLASIAKGYAVDKVTELIKKEGIKNFLIEIGGEVYASGVKKDGQCWKIGVNKPRKEAAYNEIYKIVTLKDKAFATSGDYRKFFEVNGKRYSHILDPKTGYPVANGVVSVSIIADTCIFADGLATAVMVMGRKKGLELINTLPDVEGMIVVRQSGSQLVDYPSSGFQVKGEP
ncbi:MAG: FAD:protein FMN transferase [Deltaproteobacteria bacterium]|nr:FAD:protein FMN transferase [Deltaproteobacteria bacterium]